MADASTATDGGFNPSSVDLDAANPRDVICYLNQGGNEYNGRLGIRISAIFVILVASSATTLFPVLCARVRWLRIPVPVYLFARYFGAGVIIATAFIHLLDPAYSEIGPATCVGMTDGWSEYSWPPAIAMASAMIIFLLDFGAECWVEQKYGLPHNDVDVQGAITTDASAAHGHAAEGECDEGLSPSNGTVAPETRPSYSHQSHQFLHSGDQNMDVKMVAARPSDNRAKEKEAALDAENADVENTDVENAQILTGNSAETERAFKQQIVAFLILEFGVIFHSVIIGLNLGVVGEELLSLYPVVVFHQSFEGLGIGARLSVIPFPKRFNWMPWALCAAYGLTTPIAIAIGLGLATTYDPGSFTASVVSGVLDSISAGILLYTGFVEMLGRDFLYNKERSRQPKRILYMLFCLFLGVALMALLGKWA
ncbi:zinc-regulated transporter 1 [Diplogelasinospora grovesii]|uniref:Zinc-regulated transporter 1 n=1 Tax=Diplogelasinospora grovesii TaxID=303347 RepID=A0AAN6N0N6_9PEZI|nr:zinc-regulated transporter 1 [Diplogelasinospora grovesii]